MKTNFALDVSKVRI